MNRSRVNSVKYTFMKEAVAQEVIEKKDATRKSGIDTGDSCPGDKVLVQMEGNPIYQIEILR